MLLQSQVMTVQVNEQYALFCRHLQQFLLFNLKQAPAFLRGDISCSSTLVELYGLGVVFCNYKMHSTTTGLHSSLQVGG